MRVWLALADDMDESCGEPGCRPDRTRWAIVAADDLNEAANIIRDELPNWPAMWTPFLLGESKLRKSRLLDLSYDSPGREALGRAQMKVTA